MGKHFVTVLFKSPWFPKSSHPLASPTLFTLILTTTPKLQLNFAVALSNETSKTLFHIAITQIFIVSLALYSFIQCGKKNKGEESDSPIFLFHYNLLLFYRGRRWRRKMFKSSLFYLLWLIDSVGSSFVLSLLLLVFLKHMVVHCGLFVVFTFIMLEPRLEQVSDQWFNCGYWNLFPCHASAHTW